MAGPLLWLGSYQWAEARVFGFVPYYQSMMARSDSIIAPNQPQKRLPPNVVLLSDVLEQNSYHRSRNGVMMFVWTGRRLSLSWRTYLTPDR